MTPSLKKTYLNIARCKDCPDLRTDCWARGEGNPTADIVLIGESPGQVEASKHRPFVGPAGRLLRKVLKQAGIPVEAVYLTNVVKCWPQNKDLLTDTHAQKCARFLHFELKQVQPDLVVCLGRFAFESLIHEPVEHMADFDKIWLQRRILGMDRKVNVCLMYHPAAALRHKPYLDAFREQMEWLSRQWEWGTGNLQDLSFEKVIFSRSII